MVTFLLIVVVLGVLVSAGYRLNMYLYSQGALRSSVRGMYETQSVIDKSLMVQPVYEVNREERDYGLRYARTGLIIITAVSLILAASLVFALFSLL